MNDTLTFLKKIGGICRKKEKNDFGALLIDEHQTNDAYFGWYIPNKTNKTLIDGFPVDKIIEFQFGENQDIVCRVVYNGDVHTLWIPRCPAIIQQYSETHIACSDIQEYNWIIDTKITLSIHERDADYNEIIIPYLSVKDADGSYYSELVLLSDIEKKCYLKSYWFRAEHPSDLWRYLINGSLYDPKSSKINNMRFKCQQCAFTWWNYNNYLFNATGKRIYKILCDEIAFSIYADMRSDGSWTHGVWSKIMETHSRFQIDGLNLLLSQYLTTSNREWLSAVQCGTAFLTNNLTEHMSDSMVWFLHDSIEHTKDHLCKSNILGKTENNSLCLNTHSQALGFIKRYIESGEADHSTETMYKNGIMALKQSLSIVPANFGYTFLLNRIIQSKKRMKHNYRLVRRLGKYEFQFLKKQYHRIRSKYPRIAMPHGFIERDMTLSSFSDRYHILNLKDFFILYIQGESWLKEYIHNGIDFIKYYMNIVGDEKAIASSPYYIELLDLYFLCAHYYGTISIHELSDLENKIIDAYGGTSIDTYVLKNDLYFLQ